MFIRPFLIAFCLTAVVAAGVPAQAQPMGPGSAGPGPIGPGPMGSGPMGSGPMGPGPMSPGPMGPGPMGSGPGGGPGGGPRGGMMRHGAMLNDPASYLDALKARLAITPGQEGAWDTYAGTVKDAAAQMQAMHQSVYEAMGTATWQERRDMMDRMFASRQQAMTTVHDAAGKLMEALTPAQRTQAAGILPGLGGGRGPMMGRGWR